MSAAFHKRINQSLADANLQAALDANAEKRISVRQKAFATLPEAMIMRAHAHAARKDVIENLDGYLEQFTACLLSNGIQVHRAEDALQAVHIILDIARQNGVKLIAKSKTMVSEEIELNAALERAGFKVVETDLGEYIVQIRNEPPSHIITPAVHLRRADVGRTFHEVLGIPYTDDIPTMTAAARQTLREVFLTADMGISGVNFGVAESGTLCVVTNEGNGRMVTTLPAVHVALMGMERIVPTLNDLALMLALLPRSATGQKLSVYTNLIHAPRRPGDLDGPRERHVILLDNGRSKIRQSPLSEILYCIRCGACLNACPVFREIGGHAYVGESGKHSAYPGPMGSVLSSALFGQDEFGQLARASSLCGACKEACPVDIDLPKLLLRVRAGKTVGATAPKPNTPKALKLGLSAFTWAAISPARFRAAKTLAGWAGGLGRLFVPNRYIEANRWLRLPGFTGWGASKDFPSPARKSFHQRWKSLQTQPTQAETGKGERPVLREEDATPILAAEGKLEVFGKELTELGGSLKICSQQEATEEVLAILAENQSSSILAWKAEQLPEGLLTGLQTRGIEVICPTNEAKEGNSHVKVGLTGVNAGIADTGTLLISGGEGRPLIASLLPQVHVAILREEDLHAHLAQVLALPILKQAPAAVLVSGPSRTADIEMTLTIGVHGPGILHVICIREEMPDSTVGGGLFRG